MRKKAETIDYERDMEIFVAIMASLVLFVGITFGIAIYWSLA